MSRLDAVLAWTKSFEGSLARDVAVKREHRDRNKSVKTRYASDPGFRIRARWQARLNFYMKRPLLVDKKTRFGCSQYELRTHIENLFKSGMTWKNYGALWQVDHVVPVSSFVLPEHIFPCYHFTNLRPRLCALNWIDGKFIQFKNVRSYYCPKTNVPFDYEKAESDWAERNYTGLDFET